MFRMWYTKGINKSRVSVKTSPSYSAEKSVEKIQTTNVFHNKIHKCSKTFKALKLLNPLRTRNLQTGTLSKSEDPDEMPHNAAVYTACEDKYRSSKKEVLY